MHTSREHSPGHPRHHDISDNGIEAARVVLKTGPGLRAIPRLHDAVASLLKSTDEDVPHRPVVIDQKDRAAGYRLRREGHTILETCLAKRGSKPIYQESALLGIPRSVRLRTVRLFLRFVVLAYAHICDTRPQPHHRTEIGGESSASYLWRGRDLSALRRRGQAREVAAPAFPCRSVELNRARSAHRHNCLAPMARPVVCRGSRCPIPSVRQPVGPLSGL